MHGSRTLHLLYKLNMLPVTWLARDQAAYPRMHIRPSFRTLERYGANSSRYCLHYITIIQWRMRLRIVIAPPLGLEKHHDPPANISILWKLHLSPDTQPDLEKSAKLMSANRPFIVIVPGASPNPAHYGYLSYLL